MGYLHMRINELIETAGISKNRVCKDLDIPRAIEYVKDNE